MKNLWSLIRPYFTVTRVVMLLTAVLGPPLAILSGKLAVVLADLGYNLTDAQISGAFLAGMAAFAALAVPAVVKWLDNRTKYEVAMVEKGLAHQISSKSVESQVEAGKMPATAPPTVGEPEPGTVAQAPAPAPEYDADYLASQPMDVEPDAPFTERAEPGDTDPETLPDPDVPQKPEG